MKPTLTNKDIPEWLRSRIYTTCPHCGCFMIDNENLTQRRCGYPRCPGHMAARINKLAKWFNIKNIGPGTAMSYILDFHLTSHLQIVPFLFKTKPQLYVWEIGELAMIPGYDSKWKSLAINAESMQDFISSFRCPSDLRKNAESLLYAETFFEVKAPLKGRVINVMMSGSIDGFNSRDLFIREVNERFGQYIQLVNVGKRKTGVDYLIKEPHTIDHDKTQVAVNSGIPILSSKELLRKIAAHISYIDEERRASDNEA